MTPCLALQLRVLASVRPTLPLVCSIAVVLAARCTSRGLGVPDFELDLGIADLGIPDLSAPVHKRDMAVLKADMRTVMSEDLAQSEEQRDFQLTLVARGLPEVSSSNGCSDDPVSPRFASMVGNTYTFSIFFHIDAPCTATASAPCSFTVQQLAITPDNPLLSAADAAAMVGQVGSITLPSYPITGSSAYRVDGSMRLRAGQLGFTIDLYYQAVPSSTGSMLVPFSMLDSLLTIYASSGSDKIEFDELSGQLQ